MNSFCQFSNTHYPPFRTLHSAFRCSLGLLLLSLIHLLSASVAYAQSAKHALIVSSASGGEEFKEKFWNWSSQLYQSLTQDLNFPKENVSLLAGDPGKDSSIVAAKATKAELSRVIGRLESEVQQNDLVLIVLLGHGSFDGNEYKFNLVGPDLTGSELNAILDRFSRQEVVLVCTTPCSGILTKVLSHKDRVIITATKNEFENNDTIFAQFFAEALKNKAADSDKNQEVSMLEAYVYTAQKVDRWYKDRKRLATEHPLLEDSGDRAASPLPSPENGEGLLASKISLGGPTPDVAHLEGKTPASPELQALYSKRQKLETALQELRYKKSSLADAEYNKTLEDLLVQLAQTNQKIKSLEKK